MGAKSGKHVLCFGDSLTEGFYSYGRKFHPYSLRLHELINDPAIHVENEGKSGEYTDTMSKRLNSILAKSFYSGKKYSIIILLAGTNDLSRVSSGEASDTVFSRLLELYGTVKAHGAKLVVVTMPQSGQDDKSLEYVRLRSLINDSIRSYAAADIVNTRLVDLERDIPYLTPEGRKDDALWDDVLHMTPAGYDKFGDLVFEVVGDWLKEEAL